MRFVLGGLLFLSSWCLPALAQSDDEITAARMKGIEFIRSKQDTDGSWFYEGHSTGLTALCTLALIDNGVPFNDPAVDKGYKFVRKQAATIKETYDITTSILLLSRMGEKADRNLIRGMGARLLAGQNQNGGWNYSCPAADIAILSDVRKIEKKEKEYGDNSNTQFAVIGLWAAAPYGVPIDDAMVAVARRFAEGQNDDGGWGFADTSKTSGTREGVSLGGLYCVTVARAVKLKKALKGKDERDEKDAWLADPVAAKAYELAGKLAAQIDDDWPRYNIWSVERIGNLMGIDKIGEADWYQLGAAALLKQQKEDGSWPDQYEKNGVSDTAFAILFLRKAELGGEAARIFEGVPAKAFQIANRDGGPRFDTFQEALKESQAGDVIRIDGNGPYKLSHDEISHDLTIQAGQGFEPVFEFQIGISPEGLRYKPEKDSRAHHMLKIVDGNVSLEGLRFQIDPPVSSSPIPWKTILVSGGHLRLLNCSISEGNRRGSTGVSITAPGDHSIRNSILVGGSSAIELVPNGEQQVTVDNSVIYSNVAITFSNPTEGEDAGQASAVLIQAVINCPEAFAAPKFEGEAKIDSTLTIYRCDSLGLKFLSAANSKENRSWQGQQNVYNVTSWIGFGGKKSSVSDPKSWNKFWGGTDSNNSKAAIGFVVQKKHGAFAHGMSPLDWDLSEKTELAQSPIPYGIRSIVVGPGEAFIRYRDEYHYSEWRKGKYEQLMAAEASSK